MAVPLRIGFIGSGNMAQALAKGLLSAGMTSPENIIASSPRTDQHLLDKFAAFGCKTTYSNVEATQLSDVIVMAVKPNVIKKVLKDIVLSVSQEKPLVTSVALGVTISEIESSLNPGARVIRIMPNTPALVNLGASVFSKGTHATDEDATLTARLLKSVGECDEVSESFFDATTGLSGAGPAYMYLVIEALADGGVRMGLPRDLALKLAAQTMMGSAKMVMDTGKSPGQLKDEVCSPGGCTIEGVAALENGGLRAAIMNAVRVATEKSISIATKF